jgi:tetratricopeptide (TPR) repeat protein
MKNIILLISLCLASTTLFSQSNFEKFKKLFADNDSTKITAFLSSWEKENPNDPELYVAAINYYFKNSQHEILEIGTSKKSNESFMLTDSTGKQAGYMSSVVNYKLVLFNKSVHYANVGIQKFPNRLDIRFGKCYILQQVEDYENFTKEIITAIEYSQKNNNQWLWSENQKKEDSEAFFTQTIYDYQSQLYNTENDNLLPNIIEIGEAALKYYNSKIEILSITSVAFMLTKNYNKAITYLQQAEKRNPKDFIVLNNIAACYKGNGDKANAIKYYKLTAKYGDEQAKQQAAEQIKALSK